MSAPRFSGFAHRLFCVRMRLGLLSRRERAWHRRLAAEIDALPEVQRAVVRMIRDAGLDYAEIARRLEISPDAVERHFAEALRRLAAVPRPGAGA